MKCFSDFKLLLITGLIFFAFGRLFKGTIPAIFLAVSAIFLTLGVIYLIGFGMNKFEKYSINKRKLSKES